MDSPETYTLAYTTSPPALAAHDVKHRERRSFFNGEFSFTVIGDSHYVGCEATGYHELLTCKPLDRENEALTKRIPLTVGHAETLQHNLDGTGVRTEIRGDPLSAFDAPEASDIAYRFGTDAYTTIDVVAEDRYVTYHTYPERDLALRTETTLTRPPGRE
jgi:hypothetical protein